MSLQMERFFSTLHKTETGCWLWTRATNNKGYGVLNYQGKVVYAHRLSYILHKGPIPDGLFVCHSCDQFYPAGDITNRRCINPDHLGLGTNAQNMAECFERGRMPLGENRKHSKLSDADVIQMRRRKAAGEGRGALALAFGVTKHYVGEVCSERRRPHVRSRGLILEAGSA